MQDDLFSNMSYQITMCVCGHDKYCHEDYGGDEEVHCHECCADFFECYHEFMEEVE